MTGDGEAARDGYMPDTETLREWALDADIAAEDIQETEYGSVAVAGDVRSRSADKTYTTEDDYVSVIDYLDLGALRDLGGEGMVTVYGELGQSDPRVCAYHVPEEYARNALMFQTVFEPVDSVDDPDYVTWQLPDAEPTRILVDAETGETGVFGSPYFGEVKKSFLRQDMYRQKQDGKLGVHAGSKEVVVQTGNGLESVGMLLFGLSGTGKTTLTGHGLGLEPPERTTVKQDDVCVLTPDGEALGTEGNGLFIKTYELAEDEQPELYSAATSSNAILENVAVDQDTGIVDFDSDRYTMNGRAVVPRDAVAGTADDIDLHQVDQIYFITRNRLMPPIARLDPEQAAAMFMLGESVETSAGDPDRAGEAVRVPGFNPFIMGSRGAEGNRLLDLITDAAGEEAVESYVVNTGDAAGTDIGVDETATVLRENARGSISWTADDTYGMEVPADIAGIDVDQYYPPSQLDDFDAQWNDLTADRRDYLAQFDDLDPCIAEAFS